MTLELKSQSNFLIPSTTTLGDVNVTNTLCAGL